MSLHRTVEVLAFAKPVVKATSVTLDVMTGAGEGLQLTITLGLWRQLDAAVTKADVDRQVGAQFKEKKTTSEDGRHTRKSANVRAQMLAAWAELCAGSTDSLDAIAVRNGLGAQSLGNWCRHNHPEAYARLIRIRRGKASLADYAAAGLPLPKPSGQL